MSQNNQNNKLNQNNQNNQNGRNKQNCYVLARRRGVKVKVQMWSEVNDLCDK